MNVLNEMFGFETNEQYDGKFPLSKFYREFKLFRENLEEFENSQQKETIFQQSTIVKIEKATIYLN